MQSTSHREYVVLDFGQNKQVSHQSTPMSTSRSEGKGKGKGKGLEKVLP